MKPLLITYAQLEILTNSITDEFQLFIESLKKHKGWIKSADSLVDKGVLEKSNYAYVITEKGQFVTNIIKENINQTPGTIIRFIKEAFAI